MNRCALLIALSIVSLCTLSSAQTLYWNHPKGVTFTSTSNPSGSVRAHLTLPAGYYLVTFKSRVDMVLHGYQADLTCNLFKSDFTGTLDITDLANGVDGGGVEYFQGSVLMHNEFHTNGATVTVRCSIDSDAVHNSLAAGDSITMSDLALSAVKVSTVVLQ